MAIQTNRRAFLKTTGVASAMLGLPSLPRIDAAGRGPNVVLIMTDDQGWGDVRIHGNPDIHTPHQDQLARTGIRFDRFYVSPVCAPTRASLLTGRYHLRCGVHGVTRGEETMREDETTLAEVFKANGYQTGCFGKWHNGAHYPQHPNGQGFDEFVGFCAGHWNNYFDTTLQRNGKDFKTSGYITDVLTDEAMAFISQHKDEPFFCYVPYNAPHTPWQVPETYHKKYQGQGLPDETVCAYAMCENIDDNIGRILKRLDDLNLAENTIAMFCTDNGPNSDRYNGNMRGRKGSPDEGGVRVPLFIRWPKQIEAGKAVETIASHIDILPTLVDLCGLTPVPTKPLDGISLKPLIEGDGDGWPSRILFSHWKGRGSARSQRWRAVTVGKNLDDPANWKLYDMQADPDQKTDVANANPTTLKRFQAAYKKWQADVSQDGFDPIPTAIGHDEWPVATLPGHEAILHPGIGQGISYVGANGWANDYVTNWTDLNAHPFWDVEIVDDADYQITLMHNCAEENVGAKLRVEVGGQSVEGTIAEAFNPEPIHSPDWIPRKEVYEKEWKPLTLGTVSLKQGVTKLTIRALSKPGNEVGEIKAVVVEKM